MHWTEPHIDHTFVDESELAQRGQRYLIIGGGTAALAIVHALSERPTVSQITIIAPLFLPEFHQLTALNQRIRLSERKLAPQDWGQFDRIITAHEGGNPPAWIKAGVSRGEGYWRRIATWCIMGFALMIAGHALFSAFPLSHLLAAIQTLPGLITKEFILFVLCGFAAQMVDGALGLGYGLTCTTALLAAGAPPVMVSSGIHTAEVFTTGISGYAHYRFGNVNKRLVKALLWPGLAGAVAGALLLVFVGTRFAAWTSLLLGLYCFFLGSKILFKAILKPVPKKKVRHLSGLALAGGFFDAFGGGGWGPLVTSSLIANGRSPRFVVGSVSLVEFFITLVTAITFLAALGIPYWNVIVGLIIGGAVAAPFAARLAGKLPRRTGLILVGSLIIIWSLYLVAQKLPAVLGL